MMNNSENFRKVHLDDGTFHLLASGTGIANLYSHRGTDQDEYTYVIAEIISRDKVYYMNFSNEFENWDPSTMNKVLTANDTLTATAIKDRTSSRPIYSNYGAYDIEDPSDFKHLAAWRYTNNDTELELRSLPVKTLATALQDYFYTETEVDSKIGSISGGGSAGTLREFQATVNGLISGATGEWTHYSNKSYFYIITLQYNPSGEVGSPTKLFSITVDYKALVNNRPLTFYATDSVGVTITKTVTNGYFQSITFKVATANTVFSEICGYY
jgi:hypothetical protein